MYCVLNVRLLLRLLTLRPARVDREQRFLGVLLEDKVQAKTNKDKAA